MLRYCVSLLVGIILCSCSGGGKKASESSQADSIYLHRLLEAAYSRYASPNSPERDEDLYIRTLQYVLSQPGLAYADSLRAADELRLSLLNRPGSIAADFVYELADGSRHRMHDLKAERLIIAFYDPECPHCAETLKLLDTPETRRLISADSLKVLAIYTEGNYNVWRADIVNMPVGWIAAIDRDSIVAHEIYDIPAMPIIYILDANKRVIFKDPPIM